MIDSENIINSGWHVCGFFEGWLVVGLRWCVVTQMLLQAVDHQSFVF